MGQEAALMWFLVLVFVVLAIAVIVFLVGMARARRRIGGVSHGGPAIPEKEQPVAERLGEDRPKEYGADPRGDDIGGNFSTIPNEEDANKRRS